MEFIQELKQDNELLKCYIDAEVEVVFTELLQSHSNFEIDSEILLNYLHKPGRGIGGSLVLRASQLFEQHESNDDEITIAAATEIMNAGILIIDDMVDGSEFRKSQPTVHKTYESIERGTTTGMSYTKAAQLGTLCMLLASGLASKVKTPQGVSAQRSMQHGALLVTAGQLLEAHVATDDSLRNAQSIYAVHTYKTGVYSFDAPIQSGLILADVPKHIQQSFSDIAQKLGLVFQLQDDVNGVFGSAEQTGKPTTDDVKLGLYTMLAHVACQRLSGKDLVRYYELHGKNDIDESELTEYRSLLKTYEVDSIVTAQAIRTLTAAEIGLTSLWNDQWNEQVLQYFQSIIDYLKTK